MPLHAKQSNFDLGESGMESKEENLEDKEIQTDSSDLQSDSGTSVDGEESEDRKEEDLKLENGDSCDFEEIFDKMDGVNMDDAHDVESRIAKSLTPQERAGLVLTAEDESKIMAALGVLPNGDQFGKSNPTQSSKPWSHMS